MTMPHADARIARSRPHPSQGKRGHRRAVLLALAALAMASAVLFTEVPSARAGTSQDALSPPVQPFTVERLASLPPQPWRAGHRGVDLVAAAGAAVTSPAAGVVSYVGFVVNRPVLSIRHAGGLVSSFEPIDSTAVVGDIVVAGQTVGTVAQEPRHCSPNRCLHWGLRLNGRYVDPLDYLEGFGAVVLLPLRDD